MSKEPTDSLEEQRQKTRRRLLKLGAYSIPIITTIVASGEALGACLPTSRGRVKGGTALVS